MPWGRPSASLCHDMQRRPAWERVTDAPREVGPMIDIVIAATTIALMAVIAIALERSERVR